MNINSCVKNEFFCFFLPFFLHSFFVEILKKFIDFVIPILFIKKKDLKLTSLRGPSTPINLFF